MGGGTAEGTVFKFATTASKPTTLYKFCATGSLCPNGSKPYAGLVLASNGKFYGTTTLGGTTDNGTVFQITSTGSFKTIYNFGGTTTGSLPWATPIQATDGDLYGGTSIGGADIEPPREPIALGARHVFSLLESRLGLQTAWRSGKDSTPRYRSKTCKGRRLRKLPGIRSFKNSLRLRASRAVVANRWGFRRSSKANPWRLCG